MQATLGNKKHEEQNSMSIFKKAKGKQVMLMSHSPIRMKLLQIYLHIVRELLYSHSRNW
jgi:hypothetical protein